MFDESVCLSVPRNLCAWTNKETHLLLTEESHLYIIMHLCLLMFVRKDEPKINASFNSGTFPSLFKVARVTPLLKKPSLDPNHVENYRPVSLLTLQSKTFERAASKQVTEFLSRNNLMNPNKFGLKAVTQLKQPCFL